MMGAFGKNRLASGFSKPVNGVDRDGVKESADGGSPQSMRSPAESGESADSAIEISDDEDVADSEGGIVLNFEDRKDPPKVVAISDDDEESGEIKSDDSMEYSPRPGVVNATPAGLNEEEPSFIIDSLPTSSVKKLSDLTPRQREDQIRYAFYHLDRDQIDLSRPVICLKCFDEGHLSEDCSQKTMFPLFKCAPGQQAKIWISCCVCASKDHLVGDCSDIDTNDVKRWSLAHLDPNQIVNLSLETGTRKLEREAEARGMRPLNISIKGRAGRHTAGIPPNHDNQSSDEDSFFRNKRARHEESQQRQYDRFDGPVDPVNRGRGGWYATDSFGRRRSGSPLPHDAHGPAHGRRSPPLRSDSWRPGGSNSTADSWRLGQSQAGNQDPSYPPTRPSASSTSNNGGRTAGGGKPIVKFPPGNIRVNLPTRKSSNTWTSDNSSQPDAAATATAAAAAATAPKSHSGRGKRSGKKRKGK